MVDRVPQALRSYLRIVALLPSAGPRLLSGMLAANLLLAQSLQLETVAEGVESRDSLSLLRELGCNAAQGFALGRPMPAEDFTRVVILRSEDAAIA